MGYVDCWQNSDTFKKWQCAKIDEVVKKTGVLEKDLLRLGVEGELEWWVFCRVPEGSLKDPQGNIFLLQGRFMLPRSALKALVNGASAGVGTFYTDDGTKMNVMHQVGKKEKIEPPAGGTFELFEITEPKLVSALVKIRRDELYMLPSDLEQLMESRSAVRDHNIQKPFPSERGEEDKGKFLRSLPEITEYIKKKHNKKMSVKTFRQKYEISGSSLRYVDEKFGYGPDGKWGFYSKDLEVWIKENPI